MNYSKKIVIMILILSMIIQPIQFSKAEGTTIAEIIVDDNTYLFYQGDEAQLAEKISRFEAATFTVNIYSDINGVKIDIPHDSNVTFNLGVYEINRQLFDDDVNDGEVFDVHTGASLTINGEKDTTDDAYHEVKIYTANSEKYGAIEKMYGGVITGGNSCNGGGAININEDNVNVTLNNVIIAGCRADTRNDVFSHPYGDGGAIEIYGENSNLTMNDCRIKGCVATDNGGAIDIDDNNVVINLKNTIIERCFCENDGGGIHLDEGNDNFWLYMKNSQILANYASDSGAGIALFSQNATVRGDGNSSITSNYCRGYGGGVYMANENQKLFDLTINDNKSDKDGGGVYANNENQVLSNLTLTDNKTSGSGGGIYINEDCTTITNCKVTKNSADSKGGGIYSTSDNDVDVHVTGDTVVKDNTKHNFYFENSDYINFALTGKAEVYCYVPTDSDIKLVSEKGKGGPNCIKFLKAEDSAYTFTYNTNDRYIYYVKRSCLNKEKDTVGEPFSTDVEQMVIPAGTKMQTTGRIVKSLSGNDYQVYKGYNRYKSFSDEENDNLTCFYYSDGFFDSDPYSYNPHLATLSWNLTMSGFYLNAGGTEEYDNKHAGARQFLADIGCDDQNISVNRYNIIQPGTDSIGVTVGSKKLKYDNGTETGKILVPIVTRGAGYGAEWASNVTVGNGTDVTGEHEGFAEAADKVIEFVKEYLSKYNLMDEIDAGNIVFWVSGFSRGAATSNLVSKRLVEMYEDNTVFSYNFEAPKGGTDKAELFGENEKDKYFCIHNIINACDIVPLVAPAQMGFKRYGVDHYLPGSNAKSEPVKTVSYAHDYATGKDLTDITVTTYCDNELYSSKNDNNYTEMQKKMLDQLEMIDPGTVYDQFFGVYEMFFITVYYDTFEPVKNYDTYKMEEFINRFIEKAQAWHIKNRSKFATEIDTDSNETETIQNALRFMMGLLFSMSKDKSQLFMDRASTIMSDISSVTFTGISKQDIYDDVIGDWHTLSKAEKKKYTDFFWKKLVNTGALEVLTSEQRILLEGYWPTLMNLVFSLVDGDYADETYGENNCFIGTFLQSASAIIQNHYPEVGLAWARADDIYYNNETYQYILKRPNSNNIPGAYVEDPEIALEEKINNDTRNTTEKYVDNYKNFKALKTSDYGINKYSGDVTVILDNQDSNGEAIYYDIINSEGRYIAGTELYLSDLDFQAPRNKTCETYTIKTYSKYFDVKSDIAEYQIEIYNPNHKITVKTKDVNDEDKTETDTVVAGDIKNITAAIPENMYFAGWKILDEENNNVTSKILDDNEVTNNEISFAAPLGGIDDFNYDYALTLTASYNDYITELGAEIDEPKIGEALDENATVSYEGVTPYDVDITWYTGTEKDRTEYTGNYEYDTQYYATFKVACDDNNRFSESLTVTGSSISGCDISVDKIDDKNVTITVKYPVIEKPEETP
nr:hypothetical protein [Lachnospiraceae bacterium]